MTDWWNHKPLSALTAAEWETLCDGCARCCLHKLEDIDTQEVFYTKVHCRFLDQESCRCSDYEHRSEVVPNCIRLSPDRPEELAWLPATCAYRMRSEGKPLPDWHPLVSGDGDTVHHVGISVRGRSISEQYVHPQGLEEHIIQWVN